ncbi:hypothetical protein RIF29_16174 [Crotalaria pallida]|uniref:RNase H type-1 domain-containing protein n=1 Tax=Crotalaria pallida TaxID=3830 RepID=A0AAN9FEL8_CROPI
MIPETTLLQQSSVCEEGIQTLSSSQMTLGAQGSIGTQLADPNLRKTIKEIRNIEELQDFEFNLLASGFGVSLCLHLFSSISDLRAVAPQGRRSRFSLSSASSPFANRTATSEPPSPLLEAREPGTWTSHDLRSSSSLRRRPLRVQIEPPTLPLPWTEPIVPHCSDVKANLVAAVKENVVTGMGLFIFRDHEGQILAAAVKSFCELLFLCDAEAACLLWTLKLAYDLCFANLPFIIAALRI